MKNKGWFGKLTITNRTTLVLVGVFAIAILTVSAFILVQTNIYYSDFTNKELSQTAEKVVEFINSGYEMTDEVFSDLNPNEHVGIRIINMTDRRQVIPSKSNLQFPLPSEDGFPKARSVVWMGKQYMLDQKIAMSHGKKYLIQVYMHYTKELEILNFFLMAFIVSSVIGILSMYFLGSYITRHMLIPIVKIIELAEKISIEDLSQRITVEGPDDEIKKLTLTFNDMIDRLEKSFKKQNQFISDASHELRTPISVIQGYANLIDRWGKNKPEILQESIDSIKAETEHMTMLVKKLLILAKVEQNKIPMQKVSLSLNSLAGEVIKEFNVMELSLNISLIEEAQVTISADYDLIKQLLWIFIDNGIKYSDPKQGEITITIFEKDKKGYISIKDNGTGIHSEDLPYIFERFYRADKSRSNSVPGTGLGLSIAAWIAKEHDAAVEVKSEMGDGTEIIIRFY